MNGHRYFKSFFELLGVGVGGREVKSGPLAAIMTVPLGAALGLYKKGRVQCPPCYLFRTPMAFWQLLAIVAVEAGKRLDFLLSQHVQKRIAVSEV